ncbi:hypothetical protein [Okeania sp. SIO2C2]
MTQAIVIIRILYYGEIKIKKTTGKYHVIPRTRTRTTR